MKDKILILLSLCEELIASFHTQYNLVNTAKVLRPSDGDFNLFDDIDVIIYGSNLTRLESFSSHIYFIRDSENKEFQIFATNPTYGFFYARPYKDREIVIIDENANIIFKVAQTFSHFLDVIIRLFVHELRVLNKSESDKDKEQVRTECIDLAGGSLYQDYYALLL